MRYDFLIIGGGIVGLSTAWNLLLRNPTLRLAVLEKEAALAAHQTSHNSGVIHSGIYYRPGSLKARNCLRGYELLLRFCREHGIPFDVCGKIIVAATDAERPFLEKIFQNGLANGMAGLRKISPPEARDIEPHVRAVEAIWVPQTGIIDFKNVAEKYAELAQNAGAQIFTNSPALQIRRPGQRLVEVVTPNRTFEAAHVVNCAGLYADRVAECSGERSPVKILPFRGEFYELKPARQHLVRNLIYPVPNPNFPFLGVHFTRMIRGGIEAGPNAVLAFRREGYSRWDLHFGELAETLAFAGFQKIARKYWRDGWAEMQRSYSKTLFVKALQHLVPEIGPDDVAPGRTGVRAMACDAEGNLVDDFLIVKKPGMTHVLNAPSPAATASLAVGETIAERALAGF